MIGFNPPSPRVRIRCPGAGGACRGRSGTAPRGGAWRVRARAPAAGSTPPIPAPAVPPRAVRPTALRRGGHMRRRRRGDAREGRRSWYDVAAEEGHGDQTQKKHQGHEALHRLSPTGRPALRASGPTCSRAVRSASRGSQRVPPPSRSGSSARILAGHPEPLAPGLDSRRTAAGPRQALPGAADRVLGPMAECTTGAAGTSERRPDRRRATQRNSRKVQPRRESGEASRSESASSGHHDAPEVHEASEGVPCHGSPP